MKKRTASIIFLMILGALISWRGFLYAQEEELNLPQHSNVQYNAESLRDPFQSPIKKEEIAATKKEKQKEKVLPPPTLTIQGIISGGSLPQAIIENKIVSVGDTVKDAKIVKIEKDGITILFTGMEYKIPSPAASSLGAQQNNPGG